jgi:hypothetical protein
MQEKINELAKRFKRNRKRKRKSKMKEKREENFMKREGNRNKHARVER